MKVEKELSRVVRMTNSDDANRKFNVKAHAKVENGTVVQISDGEVKTIDGDVIVATFYRNEGHEDMSALHSTFSVASTAAEASAAIFSAIAEMNECAAAIAQSEEN